jgi:hypothetical protein
MVRRSGETLKLGREAIMKVIERPYFRVVPVAGSITRTGGFGTRRGSETLARSRGPPGSPTPPEAVTHAMSCARFAARKGLCQQRRGRELRVAYSSVLPSADSRPTNPSPPCVSRSFARVPTLVLPDVAPPHVALIRRLPREVDPFAVAGPRVACFCRQGLS